jgi:hydrogenase-4 component E
VPLFSVSVGSEMVDFFAVLLLMTTFAIMAQQRVPICVNFFVLQSVFLALTAVLVAFLTGIHHIYIAAVLTIVIKVVIIPRVLKRIIERSDAQREIEMYANVPTGVLICGALVILAFFIIQPVIALGFLLTRNSLAIALAIMLIGFFIMIARKKAVTQVIGFLVMENGLFLGATASAYGMPLIVELGVFFDVLVAALVFGVYATQLQDTPDSVDTSKLTTLEEK